MKTANGIVLSLLLLAAWIFLSGWGSKAHRIMDWALKAEVVHADLYKQAHTAVTEGKDLAEFDIWVCDACGFTMEGNPPDVCPVCGVKRERFRKF